jgi:hypothetical protein
VRAPCRWGRQHRPNGLRIERLAALVQDAPEN